MALTLDGTTGISASGNIYGNNIIVTGSLTAGSFSPASLSAPGNVTGGNILTAGLVSATGNVTGNYILGNGALLTGVITSVANINNGTSNVTVTSSGGNITVGVGGTSNVAVFATTGVFVTGVNSVSGNVTGANVLTGGLISATGNITGGNVSATNLTGTLLTASQTNITAVGTLTSLSVTGTVTGGNLATAGTVSATGNITGSFIIGNGSQLTGLPAGYSNTNAASFLAAFGSNTISTTGTVTAGNITGGNILTGGLISATGNITGGNILGGANVNATTHTGATVSVTGNVTGGNILTGGLISATGNITGGNIVSGGGVGGNITGANVISGNTFNAITVSASGNITAGNLLLSGAIIDSAQLDIQTTAGNANIALAPNGTGILTVSTQVSAVGNVTGGNLLTGGLISATGNVSGGNLNVTGNIVDTGALSIITGSNGNIALTPNGTGIVTASSALSVTGNISGGNVSGTRGAFTNIAGTLETAAQTNITSVGALSSLSVTGNVTINSLQVQLANTAATGGDTTGAGLYLGPRGATITSWTYNNGKQAWITSGTDIGIETTGPITAVGNVVGANLRTAGLISATGAITGAALTGTSLTVSTGNVSCGNIVNTNANGVGNIGSATTYFNTVFAKATSAQYADLAEMYVADADYTPGTVLDFGGSKEVTATTTSHSVRIAGIVSTNPSYLMNSTLSCTNAVEVALVGRVPCLVVGTIAKGDRLVASSTPGVATRLDMAQYQPGCIVGKALEAYDSETVGTIEVAVGRL
jgi:filamentous hemagglutinin